MNKQEQDSRDVKNISVYILTHFPLLVNTLTMKGFVGIDLGLFLIENYCYFTKHGKKPFDCVTEMLK